MVVPISNINRLLGDSTNAVMAYGKTLEKGAAPAVENAGEVEEGDSLGDLVTVLTGTSLGLHSVLKKGRAARIDTVKLKALQEAIERLMLEPNTENKINAIQFAIFGYNMPLLHVLKEMQDLLRIVNSLKDSRGKKVARVKRVKRIEPKKEGE